MEGFGKSDLLVFTHENLKQYTNDFSKDNFLGETHFGKLYRGTIPHGSDPRAAHHVTVKIWENPPPNDPVMWRFDPNDNESRLTDEEVFLTDPSVIKHTNLVKLIGTCRNGSLGVVYDLNPWNTLHNLIVSDIFGWPQRIKVALGFARLLDFLHGQDGPYMVRNIDAAHILIDKECNPLLCDFSILNGGVLGNMPNSDRGLWGCFGYIDVHLASSGGRLFLHFFKYCLKDSEGTRMRGCCGNVGFLLFCDAVGSRGIQETFMATSRQTFWDSIMSGLDEWAKKEYKPPKKKLLVKRFLERNVAAKCSLVHKSLEEDPDFDARDGPIITDLAMSCLEFYPSRRPTMNEVVRKLQGLYVVKSRGEAYLASNLS